jgi:hypothetical protein
MDGMASLLGVIITRFNPWEFQSDSGVLETPAHPGPAGVFAA